MSGPWERQRRFQDVYTADTQLIRWKLLRAQKLKHLRIDFDTYRSNNAKFAQEVFERRGRWDLGTRHDISPCDFHALELDMLKEYLYCRANESSNIPRYYGLRASEKAHFATYMQQYFPKHLEQARALLGVEDACTRQEMFLEYDYILRGRYATYPRGIDKMTKYE